MSDQSITHTQPGTMKVGLSEEKPGGRYGKLVRRLLRDRVGMFGLVLVLLAIGTALIGPEVVPYGQHETFSLPNPNYDPNSIAADALNPTKPAMLSGPSWQHPLGIDNLNRDLLTRLVYGARISLLVGVLSAALATVVGSALGIASGYLGAWVDLLLQRLIDAALAIPGLLLLLLLVQVGAPSVELVVIALAVLGTSPVARVVRSAVLAVRSDVYIQAAQSVGASDLRIMVVHVVPNIVNVMIVIFSISVGANILAEAGLSFLGFGAPGPSWGRIVSDGRPFLQAKPLMSLAGGGAITITVLGLNLLGDALRDVFDPKQAVPGGRFQ